MDTQGNNSIKVLLVGNNPIEMSNVFNALKTSQRPSFETEASFDIADTFKKFKKFKPSSILIDEDFGKENIQKLVDTLKSSNVYDQIGITLIKASYCKEILLTGIQEYVLKAEISKEKLARSIINSLKIKKTELTMNKSYGKKMDNLKRLFDKSTIVKSNEQWKPTWM